MSERESKRPSLPARKECAEFKDAVEKFGKRGPAETWPNCIESEYSSSKPAPVGLPWAPSTSLSISAPSQIFFCLSRPRPRKFWLDAENGVFQQYPRKAYQPEIPAI